MNHKTTLAYTGDVQNVVTVDALWPDSPYHHIWQPFLCTDAGGQLVAAYGTKLHSKGDMGALWCARSRDGGQTWTRRVPILHHDIAHNGGGFGYANPVLYRAPGCETIWCFAMRSALHMPNTEFSQLCAAVSSDGGASWRPVELAVLYPVFPITCQHITAIPDDEGTRYLLPVHVHFSKDFPGDPSRAQMVLASRDLLTWRLGGYVPCQAEDPAFLHEGGIAAGDEPGEWVMAMRTAAHNRYPEPHASQKAFVSTSRDGGRTWSVAAPEPALHNTVAKGYFGDDGHGLQIYVYSAGPAWQRGPLHYTTRRRGGPWAEPRPFFDQGGAEGKNSYPTLIAQGPGKFACIWDSSDAPGQHRQCIRFGTLEV